MNISSLFLVTLLPSLSKLKFSIEIYVTSVSFINSSFWKGSISISSLIFSLALSCSIKNNVKNNKSNANFELPTTKIQNTISYFFPIKGFCNIFKCVFYLQIIKLMNKKVEVKREVKGQGERTFTNITTITHF